MICTIVCGFSVQSADKKISEAFSHSYGPNSLIGIIAMPVREHIVSPKCNFTKSVIGNTIVF